MKQRKIKFKSKVNSLTPRQKQIKFRNKMKKVGYVAIACFFVGTIGFVGNADYETELVEAGLCTEYETETRTEKAVLVEIENGNYVLQTEDGNLWEITDAPEVIYKVTFDTNGTVEVEDDVIVGIK